MAESICYWQSALITTPCTLIPKCNDPSQFKEDAGKPLVPVREFNLMICPLVQSCQKTPFWTLFWTLPSKSP